MTTPLHLHALRVLLSPPGERPPERARVAACLPHRASTRLAQ